MPRATQVLASLLVFIASVASPPDGQATAAEPYSAPVDAVVVDPYRAPDPAPYGAGNRGWEYATTPGSPVTASAAGEVLFAGRVASTLHVTIAHDDGLRTSYSYLATVEVHAGVRVARGQRLGTADRRFHFGIRDVDGTYLDPALVLAGRVPQRPRLVPGAGEGLAELRAAERWALAELVRATLDLAADGAVAAAGDAVVSAREGVALLSHYRARLDPLTHLAEVTSAIERWRRSRSSCTPPGTPAGPPGRRRVAVLVAGLGSTSESASVDEVDVDGLGYAPGDVVRFSYSGGRIPDPGDDERFSGIPANPYAAADTMGDLRSAGARLALLLSQVAHANPGVAMDVIAHSQGGVVTRLALTEGHQVPVELQTVVTLGTPHGGSDLATTAAALRVLGRPTGTVETQLAPLAGFDPSHPAIRGLAETSDVVTSLEGTDVAAPSPDGTLRDVNFVSIAARGDLVVPVPRTVVDGEPHAVVPMVGPSVHSELPGAPEATREIALAVAGMGPTCASLADAVADAAAGQAISIAADAYGMSRVAALAAGAGLP